MPPTDPLLFRPSWAARYAVFLERRAVLVIVVLAALTALLGAAASRLRLRTDFVDLLPQNRESVQALRRITERLGGTGTINVAIETSDTTAGKHFVTDLVLAVRERLGQQIRSIDYTVAKVREFYRKNGTLFLSRAQLLQLDTALAEAIREQTLKNNPLYVDLEEHHGPSETDRARRLLDDIERRARQLDRFPQGYYIGEHGKLLGVFMRTKGSAVEIGEARVLLRRMQALVAELQPQRYSSDMQVEFTGTLRTTVDEYDSIVRDIVSTAGLCVTLVAAVVWFYFRQGRVLVLLAVVLTAGAIWAFGLGSLGFGYVNAQTAFLGSIIVGTGINYGIILLSRYQEERRAGLSPSSAMSRAIAFTKRPTLAAAITTALAFGTLGVAQMRSFAQFGFIGGVGMAACWLLSYTLLPALTLLLERTQLGAAGTARPAESAQRDDLLRICYPDRLVRFPPRHAVAIVAITGILFAWSTVEIVSFLPRALESDMNKLRRRGGTASAVTRVDDRLGAIFGQTLVPAVIVTETPQQAGAVCRSMEQIRARNPRDPVIGWCQSIESFIPSAQQAKLQIIAQIRRRLDRTPRALLPAELRHRLEEVRQLLPERPVRLADVPEEIRARFRDRRGAETVVLIAPGEKRTLWKTEDLLAFADALHTIRLPDGTVLHSSGDAVIFADLLRTIAHDAPRTTALAAASVLVVLTVMLRRLRAVVTVGASLVAGVTVMAGLAAALHVKYNFFNFVALPTTFGIAVDYPVNIQQRYAQEGDMERTLRETGAAVLVASLTTITGYGVLLISDSLTLASFGSLAILGEATCLVAALLLLPALQAVLERRAATRRRADHPGRPEERTTAT